MRSLLTIHAATALGIQLLARDDAREGSSDGLRGKLDVKLEPASPSA